MAHRMSPSVARNREPLLQVLREVLPPKGVLVEIAAGSGEHAVFFAPFFPGLQWIPTDRDPGALASIAAHLGDAPSSNLEAPVALDVALPWPFKPSSASALLCVNLIHISPWESTVSLMAGAATVLSAGGVLVTYGPYRIDGAHTAPSNVTFDEWLKAQDPAYGVRDLEAVVSVAQDHGLQLEQRYPMPANNFTLVFRVR